MASVVAQDVRHSELVLPSARARRVRKDNVKTFPQRHVDAEQVQARQQSMRKIGLILALVSIVLGCAWMARDSLLPATPIENLRLYGDLQKVTQGELQQIVAPHVEPGFWRVDLAQVQQALLQQPWIFRADVRRVWPNGLSIHLQEQAPVARWRKDGLLNPFGDVFYPPAAQIPNNLAKLSGPEKTQGQVIQQYLEISKIAAAVNWNVVDMRMDDRRSWSLTLNNGVHVTLGREQIKERFERFARHAASMEARAGKGMAGADLRYANGIAVTWLAKNETANQSENQEK